MWLAIEGLIGSGKTTTAKLLASLTGLTPALETLSENSFLEPYYEAPGDLSLETELSFTLMQAHQIDSLTASANFVTDYAPAKNMVFATETLAAEDLRLFSQVDLRIWERRPAPALTVFLDVPPATCQARIRARGRRFEQQISEATLVALRNAYLARLSSLGSEVHHLELTGSESSEEVTERVLELTDLTRHRAA